MGPKGPKTSSVKAPSASGRPQRGKKLPPPSPISISSEESELSPEEEEEDDVYDSSFVVAQPNHIERKPTATKKPPPAPPRDEDEDEAEDGDPHQQGDMSDSDHDDTATIQPDHGVADADSALMSPLTPVTEDKTSPESESLKRKSDHDHDCRRRKRSKSLQSINADAEPEQLMDKHELAVVKRGIKAAPAKKGKSPGPISQIVF